MSQTLYENGTILTMETPTPVEALLTEDGIIVKAGSLDEIHSLLQKDVAHRDLDGQTLMPAFIDPHSHFLGYANSLLQIPLDDAATFSDIVRLLEDGIRDRKIPKGEWVAAKGYDHNALAEGIHPTRELLDQAAPDHPVVLQHRSGHMGVFNSKALAMLGVDEHTPQIPGGLIQTRDGRCTGYMEENAYLHYLHQTPPPMPESLLDAVQTAQEHYASYGITTVQEGMMTDSMLPIYEHLTKQNLLKLDVVGYGDIRDCRALTVTFALGSRKYTNHFRLGGFKIFLDGSPQGRTAWMRKPYEGDSSGYCGYPTLPDEAVQDHVNDALSRHVQLLAHCNGDAACAQYIRAFARAKKNGADPGAIRPVMVHAQLLGLDQLEAVKNLGILPSFFPAHIYYWGDTHLKNFGPQRAAHISPAASAQKMGISYTFHQDAPVLAPNMLETIWCAVCRMTKSETLLGGDERISVWDALKAITINGAYQYFEEASKGTLSPGKKADLVILDRNPLTTPDAELRNIQVMETIKEGQTIYQNPDASLLKEAYHG
ncbi:MAG: amidohydrolase [Blautia sp.]